jgi:RNA polymerase sigma-70 factor (ECF subfamily)
MEVVVHAPEQFKNWYEDYQSSFMSIGLRLGYCNNDVKDVINQFFLDLLEKNIDPKSISNPKAYLSTAFRRKLIDHYRHSSEPPLSIETCNKDYSEPSIQQILEQIETNRELINTLRNAYRKLPARCRKVIDLKFYHGLTTEEIVLQTRLSKRSVYNNLFEGMKLLRAELNRSAPMIRIAALSCCLFIIVETALLFEANSKSFLFLHLLQFSFYFF